MIFSKKPFEHPKNIEINGDNYIIKVDFFPKKNSSVSIKKNVLDFRMSKYLFGNQKNKHFTELLNKIKTKIEKNPNKVQIIDNFNSCLESGKFKFSNEIYYIEKTVKRGIKLFNNTFYVNTHTKNEQIKKKIIKLLISKYEDKIKNYVLELNSQTYNYHIKDIEIKDLESKWGHCTIDNKIMLNLKLLNANINIFNYVIYHEISHITHKNHSNRFWNEVSLHCPNYKVLRKNLRTNPPQIFNKI